MPGLPKRKNIRLANYDYSSNGAYFITICTKDKKNILWDDNGLVAPELVGASNESPPIEL